MLCIVFRYDEVFFVGVMYCVMPRCDVCYNEVCCALFCGMRRCFMLRCDVCYVLFCVMMRLLCWCDVC